MDKDLLWEAYLRSHLALHAAIDQQGSTMADDAKAVAGVYKTIERCRLAANAVDDLCGNHLPQFDRRYQKGDF